MRKDDSIEKTSTKDPSLTLLCERIEQVVNRKMRTPKDFDFLSERIFDAIHQQISATTLKRLWGYLSEPVTPRPSTLNLLAQFVGSESWNAFCQQAPNTSSASEETPAPTPSGNKPRNNYPPQFRNWRFLLPFILITGGVAWGLYRLLSPSIITFADPAVKALCVAHWDTDKDGELSYAEAAAVTDLGKVFTDNKDITSFDELQYFTGLNVIGEQAFLGCGNLTSVVFPNSVTEISHRAFEGTAWVNVTIPSSMRTLGYNSFAFCNSLIKVVCEEGLTHVDINAFAECPRLEEVILPSTLKKGGMLNVFGVTPQLAHVVMPLAAPITRHAELFSGKDLKHSVLFTIPEGAAKNYLQKGYYNISDNSELAWMRDEFEAEATRVEVLKTAEGITASTEAKKTLQDAITAARSAAQNADSYLAIGTQIEAVKSAAKTFLGTATIAAGTDVTAIVRNPQFERMDMGWDVTEGTTWQGCSIGYQNDEGYNDYTNGEVNIHNFLEVGWNGVALGNGRLSQTITNLPAGVYRLECDAIATWKADASVEVTGVNLFVGVKKTPLTTEDKKPQHFTVDFTQYRTDDCTIGIDINNTNANWVAMDNVRLYYLGALPLLHHHP